MTVPITSSVIQIPQGTLETKNEIEKSDAKSLKIFTLHNSRKTQKLKTNENYKRSRKIIFTTIAGR